VRRVIDDDDVVVRIVLVQEAGQRDAQLLRRSMTRRMIATDCGGRRRFDSRGGASYLDRREEPGPLATTRYYLSSVRVLQSASLEAVRLLGFPGPGPDSTNLPVMAPRPTRSLNGN